MSPFDESESEPLVSPDNYAATRFNPEEAPPGKQSYWKRLAGYQSGIKNLDWVDRAEQRRQDNLAVFDAISSQLELTRWQKQVGRELFDGFDLRRIGYPVELVAFCICVWVVEGDGRIYHPQKPDSDELFQQFASDLNLNLKHVQRCLARFKAMEGR
jgi:hypothetical protein